uniref:Uncharacterized protein n=1 Tax=Alexandrium catenella TaxID=2925 RepID=A0A7S1WPZ8_ALECA
MEVKLLRGRDGRVIFMEAPSQFVDALVAITRSPLGAVVGAIADGASLGPGQAVPGKDLCESVASLREDLFASKKADALQKPVDLESIVRGEIHADIALPPPRTQQVAHQVVGKGIKLTSQGVAWNTNAVFDVGGQHDFEVTWCAPWQNGHNHMIGIALASVDVTAANLYQHCGFYMQINGHKCVLYGQDGTSNKQSGLAAQGNLLKMKLTNATTTPVLQYAFGDGPFVTATFSSPIPAGQSYGPAILFAAANQSVTIELTSAQSKKGMQKVMSSTVRFLVTNRLQVLENSSATAIQLIAERNGESLAGLRSESVQVTASAWRRLIAGALLGRDDILDFAFPAADGDAASTAGGSETSFQLTFPEERAA